LILTLNSEYLRDRNNRAVFVMDTEYKMFNTCSVSRAKKDISCVQSTLRFYCLACKLTGVTPPDCFAWCLLCTIVTQPLVTYVSGLCAGHTADSLAGWCAILSTCEGLNLTDRHPVCVGRSVRRDPQCELPVLVLKHLIV